MNRPDFPHVIDSSILSAFKSCPQKFNLQYINHWVKGAQNIHLHAGAAFAKGLEVTREAYYCNNHTPEDSIGMGLAALIDAYGDFDGSGSNKDFDRMLGAFEFFFESYPLETDEFEPLTFDSGKRGIEFSFAEPLPIKHPLTGDPIIFSGRADMIGTYAGSIYLEDDKTTSSLGATWPYQWDLRSQFSAYCWAARKSLNIPVKGMLVRGVSILKTKYDTAQCITYRAEWELDRWYEQTLRDISNMIEMWETGYFDYNLDNACNEFGGCMFKDICKSKHPEEWLNSDYIKVVWDPLSRTQKTLEEYEQEWNS